MSALISIFRKTFSLLFALLFSLAGAVSSQPAVTTGELVLKEEFAYPYSEGGGLLPGDRRGRRVSLRHGLHQIPELQRRCKDQRRHRGNIAI